MSGGDSFISNLASIGTLGLYDVGKEVKRTQLDRPKKNQEEDLLNARNQQRMNADAAEQELLAKARKRRGRASTLLADAEELAATAPELSRASLLGETWKA